MKYTSFKGTIVDHQEDIKIDYPSYLESLSFNPSYHARAISEIKEKGKLSLEKKEFQWSNQEYLIESLEFLSEKEFNSFIWNFFSEEYVDNSKFYVNLFPFGLKHENPYDIGKVYFDGSGLFRGRTFFKDIIVSPTVEKMFSFLIDNRRLNFK